jgi:hypothetical protein
MKFRMIKYVCKSNVILEMAHAWVVCLIHVVELQRATGKPSRLRSMATCYRQYIANLVYLCISYLDNGMLLCKVLPTTLGNSQLLLQHEASETH